MEKRRDDNVKKDSFRHVLSLLLFGSNGVVASHIALSACEIVFLRTFIGTLVLGAVFFGTGRRFSLRGAKADLAAILLSGAAMGAGWMLLYEAYARVGVSMASLLYYCGPVVVVALAPVFFGERIGKGTLLGFAAVLAGIFLVNGGSGSVRPDRTGVVCGILSAGCLSLIHI